MALREFDDGKGNLWRVWATRPQSGRVREQFRGGWLTFEPGGREASRRRLAPIPDGWEALSEFELRQLCIAAAPERSRKPPLT
jgi:hypothetical protein